jgi:hypothetical protein
MGNVFRDALFRYMEATKPLLLEYMISSSGSAQPRDKEAELNGLYQYVRGELASVAGLASIYHIIWAIKS